MHRYSFTLLFYIVLSHPFSLFFFFNDTATTEIYTLSLHDALPIWQCDIGACEFGNQTPVAAISVKRNQGELVLSWPTLDRKSTRLNSSHGYISYAVFCLKKKKK